MVGFSHGIVGTFRAYPELAIFLALALGYWLGGLRIGTFRLGAVTGVLLAGIAVGQMNVSVSADVKSTFFLLFLFAVGYAVGPQFFAGLRRDGGPQVVFAVLQCLVSIGCAYLAARLLGYDAGAAAGLLSGSQTASPALGVAADTIGRLDLPAAQKALLADRLTVAFTITYLFGTAGAPWLLASLGPKLLGVDLAAECARLEKTMGIESSDPGTTHAGRRFEVRAYTVTNDALAGTTVGDFEARFASTRTAIERIRHDGAIADAAPATVIRRGDVVAVVGRRADLVENPFGIGPEAEDHALIDFEAEVLDVVVTNKAAAGRTLTQLGAGGADGFDARGVYVRALLRGGHEMPFCPDTVVHRGDVLQLVGSKRNVERAVQFLGYADRPTDATDMLFVAAGIVLGGLIGASTVQVGGIPLSLSTSGGALIAGLVFGWLRSVHPTFGRVPAPAVWLLSNLGLNAFVAAIGISAGPRFFAGLAEAGPSLFLAGVVVSSVPLIVGILMGHHLFKFHPGVTLGAACGARTASAALGAIQEAARSKIPALGYTVTYAVGNTVLTVCGLAIVLLTQ